jgi:hypothetical protein
MCLPQHLSKVSGDWYVMRLAEAIVEKEVL